MSDAAPRFAQGVRLERGCEDFAEGISAAVDYRGDVTIHRRNGDLVGYLFDATADRLGVMPADGGDRTAVPVAEVEAIEFSGKDAASGRTWENWVRRYIERKQAGKSADIESERLD